jgi:hypothetical protein
MRQKDAPIDPAKGASPIRPKKNDPSLFQMGRSGIKASRAFIESILSTRNSGELKFLIIPVLSRSKTTFIFIWHVFRFT